MMNWQPMVASVVMALAACGKAAPAPTMVEGNLVADDVTAVSEPPYLGIFVDGRTWIFDVATEFAEGDDPADTVRETLLVTCTVNSLEREGSFTTANVLCDQEPSPGNPISAHFTMNDQGFWRGVAGDVAGPPEITAEPATYVTKKAIARDDGGGEEGVELSQDDDTWCLYDYVNSGDAGSTTICISANQGFVSARKTFDGYSSHVAEFTLRVDE